MLGNLCYQLSSFVTDLYGIIDLRKNSLGKLDIQDGTDHLGDLTCILCCHLITPFSLRLVMPDSLNSNSVLPHLK